MFRRMSLFRRPLIYIKDCRAQTPRLTRGSRADSTRPLQATSLQPD